MSGENITFEMHGRTYTWSGNFGAIIQSTERGVEQGQTRVIDGILFYAYMVRYKEVSWSIPGNFDSSRIEEIRRKFLGV